MNSFFRFNLCCLIFSLCFSISSHTQNSRWQTGINLGLDMTNLRVGATSPGGNSPLRDMRINNKAGFDLGIGARYRLTQPLYLRFGTGILFQNADIYFRWDDNDEHIENFEMVSIYAPVVLEFQNDKLPLSPLFFMGLNFSYHLNADDREIIELPIRDFDIGAYFGIGAHHRFSRFAFRPEISFNLGLTNLLLTPKEARYQESVESIRRDLISLRLMFLSL